MGRKRGPNEKPSYVKAPEVPAELAERMTLVTQVIAGTLSMSEGARRAGIERNNFQTLVNRTKASMVAALSPRPLGPKPKPAREVELEEEIARLRRTNEELTRRTETIDRLLGVAGEMLKGQRKPKAATRSSRRSSPSSTSSSTGGDEDPEPAAILAKVTTMRDAGIPRLLGAQIMGVSTSTLRRWAEKLAAGGAARSSSRSPALDERRAAEVRRRVEKLGRIIGAASLAVATGVSRRQAAALKREVLTDAERARKASAGHVVVHAPGVIRGFDPVFASTTAGRQYLFHSADACIPYKTRIELMPDYDARAVRDHLKRDFAEHGVPLVVRMDRAACHDAPAVASFLKALGVTVLHGPPRHPRYYGQLERQNRDVRAWLEAQGILEPPELDQRCRDVRVDLNELWPRRTLDWSTPARVWEDRQPMSVDRQAFRDEVADRLARLRAAKLARSVADRLAVEDTLTSWCIIRIEPPRRVLRG